MSRPTERQLGRFIELVWRYYRNNGRRMPWRETRDPYRILVSEMMLQQTQVERVFPKYAEFLEAFPDFHALARSTLRDVLGVWQGLGYNRRARFLREAAVQVCRDHGGVLPQQPDELARLPGVGQNTAGALAAFAYDVPTVFVETNIRRTFIHFFFADGESVPDREICPLIHRTLDHAHPREWYYALMDYGAMLKARFPNANRRSAHYTRQSPFANSNRQIRGRVLKEMSASGVTRAGGWAVAELAERIDFPYERVSAAVDGLARDGLVKREGDRVRSVDEAGA